MLEMDVPKVLYCAFAEVPGPSALGTRMRHWLQVLPDDVEVDALTLRGEGLPHIQRVGLSRMMRVAAEGETFEERLQIFQRALARQLAAEPYDLVFCADVFSAEIAADAKVAQERKTKKKSVLVLEAGALPATAFASLYPVDKHDSALKQKWAQAEKKVFKAVDIVLVPSRYAARFFSARVDARRVQLLPRLVERYIFHPEAKPVKKDEVEEDNRKLVVVFERRASARRTAVLRIIQALNESTTRRQVRLAILGKAVEGDRLQADLDKLFLNRVELLDGNSPQEIAGHLCAADVVVVPSALEEGLDGFTIPHRALEAMACKKPVVVTGSEAPLRSVLQNGRCGVVVPEQDPEAAASSVVKLLESPGWRDELVQAAFAKVSESVSRRAVTPKLTTFLGDLLKMRFSPRLLEFDGELVEDPPLAGTDLLAQKPSQSPAEILAKSSAGEVTSPNPKSDAESLLPPPLALLDSLADLNKNEKAKSSKSVSTPSPPEKNDESESIVFAQNDALSSLKPDKSSSEGDEPESLVLAENEALSSIKPGQSVPAVQSKSDENDENDENDEPDSMIFAANEAADLLPTTDLLAQIPMMDDDGAFADSTFAAPRLVDAMSVPSDHISEAALDESASLDRASQGRPPPLPAKKAPVPPKKALAPENVKTSVRSSRFKSDAHPKAPAQSVLIDSDIGKEHEGESTNAAENKEIPPFERSAFTQQDHPEDIATHTRLAPSSSKRPLPRNPLEQNRRPPPIRKVAPDVDSGAQLKSTMPAFSKALRVDLQAEPEPGKSGNFASGGALADTQVSPRDILDADRNLTKEDENASNAADVVDAIRIIALGSDSKNDMHTGQDSQPRDPWRHDTVADASPLFPDSAPELVDLALNLTGDAFRPPPTRPVRIEAETSSSSQPVSKAPSFDHTTEDHALHPSSEG
ncbi:MAG: glycosyltransferase family 4 protein [Deltaproteobacteria bacterium]|nr:glycosyltransferase family 4 protein [Deltaproteobacteria bacterium]